MTPFDGTATKLSDYRAQMQPPTAADIAQQAGVVSVTMDVLERYKIKQANRYPGHLLWRWRRTVVPLATVFGCCMGVIAVIIASSPPINIILIGCVLAIWSAMVACFQPFMRGPAQWKEICRYHHGTAASHAALLTYSGWFDRKFQVGVYKMRNRGMTRMPEDILDRIKRFETVAKEHGQEVTMILGILQQEMTILDPYVLVRILGNGDTICLGIWDETGIIA